MFKSTEMIDFGFYIKNVRKQLNYSQQFVSDTVGINVDTLRKIEGGLVVPRYETLTILSTIYKINLVEVFSYYSSDKKVMALYADIDKAILKNDISSLKSIKKTIITNSNELNLSKELIIKSELDQLITYLECLIDYYNGNTLTYFEISIRLINALKVSSPKFNLNKLDKQTFNSFELRLLILYALCLSELKDYNKSTEILLKVLDNVEITFINPQIKHHYEVLILFNLSYNFHNTNDFSRSLDLACRGIELCIENNSMKVLPQLYYRKFAAEYNLAFNESSDSYKKCILLLEITKDYDLRDKYIEITRQHYPNL